MAAVCVHKPNRVELSFGELLIGRHHPCFLVEPSSKGIACRLRTAIQPTLHCRLELLEILGEGPIHVASLALLPLARILLSLQLHLLLHNSCSSLPLLLLRLPRYTLQIGGDLLVLARWASDLALRGWCSRLGKRLEVVGD